MKKIFKFYDTCSILLKADFLFQDDENIAISSVTLEELEGIKTSATKSLEVKAAARAVTRQLEMHSGEFEIEIYYQKYEKDILKLDLPVTNDTKILACARRFTERHDEDEVYFVTNDLACKNLAALFLDRGRIESFVEEPYAYDGYKEVILTNDEMADFYSNRDEDNST